MVFTVFVKSIVVLCLIQSVVVSNLHATFQFTIA